eukprot:1156896-Pelagomonas_calceolata.AAC.2
MTQFYKAHENKKLGRATKPRIQCKTPGQQYIHIILVTAISFSNAMCMGAAASPKCIRTPQAWRGSRHWVRLIAVIWQAAIDPIPSAHDIPVRLGGTSRKANGQGIITTVSGENGPPSVFVSMYIGCRLQQYGKKIAKKRGKPLRQAEKLLPKNKPKCDRCLFHRQAGPCGFDHKSSIQNEQLHRKAASWHYFP